MHARLVSFSGANAETRDRWHQTIQETVIPTLRRQDGFAGYIALYSEATQDVKGVVLWDSEQHAEAAEQALKERRREVSGGVGLTVESAELYEVLTLEMETTRG
jgi:hypothetical protein